MSRFEIKMPKLGESITEGTIVSWSVKVGDTIQEDDILFEVNTAKVSAEIPSPVAGKVVEILYKEGDTVAVGTVVAVVDPDGEESSEETTASENTGKEEANPSMNTISAVNGTKTSIESESQPTEPKDQPQELNPVVVTEERWYSPVVIQLAREANISKEELDTIQGTGYEGRLSKKDIKDYIDKKKRGVSNVKSASSASVSSATTTSVAAPKQTTSTTSNIPGVEVKEMDRVRRILM